MDEYLDSVGGRVARDGVNRSKVYELVREATFTSLWDRIKAKSPLDRRPLLDELTRMATRLPGIKYPLPDAITRELIANAPDETVAFDLYHTISMWIRCGGGDGTASRLADLFDRLPRGLQLVYTLTKLESDTHNGGISMAISRWADARPDIDRFPTETYHDRYLRQHPDKFICGKGYKNRRKCRRI